MFFYSLAQTVQIEQGKLYAHTGTYPRSFPFVGRTLASIKRGEFTSGALHLSSLVRLNADLRMLQIKAPAAYSFYTKRWLDFVGMPAMGSLEVVNHLRGWRVEVLTAAELASLDMRFQVGDSNPRVLQEQPDLTVDFDNARLSIECKSVEPTDNTDLVQAVRSAAWNKGFDPKKQAMRAYVGPDALLMLDITSVAARHASNSGKKSHLNDFSRSVARALTERAHRHGTDWGAVVLHFMGAYREPAIESLKELYLENPAWAVSARGSHAILNNTNEPWRIVNRSFYSLIRYKPSRALDSLIEKCYPLSSGQSTINFDHLPWAIIY